MPQYLEKVTNLTLSYTRGDEELTIHIPGPMILEGVMDSGIDYEQPVDLQFNRTQMRFARHASPALEFNVKGISLHRDPDFRESYLTMKVKKLD